jgi:hypothetical protein
VASGGPGSSRGQRCLGLGPVPWATASASRRGRLRCLTIGLPMGQSQRRCAGGTESCGGGSGLGRGREDSADGGGAEGQWTVG